MKNIARKAVALVLGWQVRKLTKKNNFKVVAVTGSIGKTSTKLAVAMVLSAKYRVRFQDGNYNDLVTVPLIFFGEQTPSLFNPLAWLVVFWRNQKQLRRPYPYDYVVVELGSDGPGQIIQLKRYLQIEIGVLTSITPEHMEYFGTLDAVAKEETAIGEMSSLVLVNTDLTDAKYLALLPSRLTYGMKAPADFSLESNGAKYTVKSSGQVLFESDSVPLSEPELYSVLAASAVGVKLDIPAEDIKKGIANIKPVPGRMQRLSGVNDSIIIDDSYNSSPEAAKLALNTLYKLQAPQKIAVLGNMNELGAMAEAAHQEIGGYCDPKQLELVVTIGPEANKYLAASAESKGCSVKSFDSPYAAGEYIKPLVKSGAVILVKGSQNRVFAEETIKSLLADPADAQKLVRQTKAWMDVKQKAFKV